ncbi:hypothetical protein MKT60_016680 [Providencia rettgeri]|uniref:hypothetical protein n=1 Tax=Providencia TaxID=586 RepID=UPI001EE6C52F|nr:MULTISPECIES: hypothetical protein [Providencia]EMC8779177.1 hypothetical protein [Providencia rettgeri]MCG5369099.1 hypothetical protein [Providencia rettgeri]MCL0008489.1 hypothetical protein [Providencia rettgeri]
MNISDLDPVVQCEILRLAHDYAAKQRDEIKRSGRLPRDEKEWYGDRVKEATVSLVNLYKQRPSN